MPENVRTRPGPNRANWRNREPDKSMKFGPPRKAKKITNEQGKARNESQKPAGPAPVKTTNLPYMAVPPISKEALVPQLVPLGPEEERQIGNRYRLRAKVEEDDATPEISQRLLDLPIKLTI